jgi:inhibitor of KinA
MIKNISNLGDAALYCDFGDEVNKEINSDVIKYFNSIKENKIKGVNNLTPSYNKLIISYDLKVTNFKEIKQEIEKLSQSEGTKTIGKNLEIPVCCDKSFSLDMERLEKKLDLKKDEILENFFNKNFFCYMTGFIAGMPFLGDLDEQHESSTFRNSESKSSQRISRYDRAVC